MITMFPKKEDEEEEKEMVKNELKMILIDYCERFEKKLEENKNLIFAIFEKLQKQIDEIKEKQKEKELGLNGA